MSNINDYKIGSVVYGKITGIKPYGAFVKFSDGISGLIHISELSNHFVKNVDHFVNIDDYVMCKVIDIDTCNKQLRLSFKALSNNTRKYASSSSFKFEGVPTNKIGFKSLKDKMPKWLEGKFYD